LNEVEITEKFYLSTRDDKNNLLEQRHLFELLGKLTLTWFEHQNQDIVGFDEKTSF